MTGLQTSGNIDHNFIRLKLDQDYRIKNTYLRVFCASLFGLPCDQLHILQRNNNLTFACKAEFCFVKRGWTKHTHCIVRKTKTLLWNAKRI